LNRKNKGVAGVIGVAGVAEVAEVAEVQGECFPFRWGENPYSKSILNS
jgi:hypothetical protein